MRAGILKTAALAAALLAACVSQAGEGDVLYWMVDNTATVTDGEETMSVLDFLSSAEGGSSYAARIRVTGDGITEDTFLNLYLSDGTLDVGNGDLGVEFGTISGYWGAGAPYGVQADISAYTAGPPEFSFIVELGNIDSSDNWTTVAESAAVSYSSLGSHLHDAFELNPVAGTAWKPTDFTAVPEPSGGLLAALGLAILALRRRREG